MKKWWKKRDSNPRPTGCKPVALPTELFFRNNTCSRRDGENKADFMSMASPFLFLFAVFSAKKLI